MRTVWITGGSRGIGNACVRLFAAHGWQTAFTYHKSDEAAKKLALETGALALQGDMTQPDEVARCAAAVREQLGCVDALVCNVGIAQQKMFCDLTDADWQQMFAANLMSAVYAVRAVLPDLVHRKSGSIVTVSSMWGISGASCESHYAASKAALIGLTKSLAQELGPSGIRVNCVAPGVIDTDMNRMHGAETMQQLAQQTAVRRIGTPEEVAQAVVFLCEPQSNYVTGQVLPITGGFEA